MTLPKERLIYLLHHALSVDPHYCRETIHQIITELDPPPPVPYDPPTLEERVARIERFLEKNTCTWAGTE